MSYYEWQPYVTVGERRRQAARKLSELKKQGRPVSPVTVEGRKIAKSFWGMSWCSNLERYSDYANRLPRGRSYVRNGSVVDLQITRGKVAAMVAGSELYKVEIGIAPVSAVHWRAICRDCAGTVDSLVELLQGRLAKSVMDRVCRQGDGLFPSPREIKLSCSCPDWAGMCKHVAAVLYGIGARLDQSLGPAFRAARRRRKRTACRRRAGSPADQGTASRGQASRRHRRRGPVRAGNERKPRHGSSLPPPIRRTVEAGQSRKAGGREKAVTAQAAAEGKAPAGRTAKSSS